MGGEEIFKFEVKDGGILRGSKVGEHICFDVELPTMRVTCFLRMTPEEVRSLGKLLQNI